MKNAKHINDHEANGYLYIKREERRERERENKAQPVNFLKNKNLLISSIELLCNFLSLFFYRIGNWMTVV